MKTLRTIEASTVRTHRLRIKYRYTDALLYPRWYYRITPIRKKKKNKKQAFEEGALYFIF